MCTYIILWCDNSHFAYAVSLFRFVDQTLLDTHTHTPGRTSQNKCSARRRGRYIHNKQQAEGANINALPVIRTRDPGI